MVKISIIMPAFNAENWIEKSIMSVLAQSFQDFELLIVNDGSKDRTADIVNSFSRSDSRVRLINQNNQGVSAARNKGLYSASGYYIAFLDSDDLYNQFFLEKMVAKMDNTINDVCYCGFSRLDGVVTTKMKSKLESSFPLLDYLLGKLVLHTSTWLIRKKLITDNNIKFDTSLAWGEDYSFFCLILSLSSSTTFVNEHLTYYRAEHNINQLSSFSFDKIDKDYFYSIKLLNDERIVTSKKIERAIKDYRMSALITYRLYGAVKSKKSKKKVNEYYKKYSSIIKPLTWNNGLRSIKLNFYKLLLMMKIRNN